MVQDENFAFIITILVAIVFSIIGKLWSEWRE